MSRQFSIRDLIDITKKSDKTIKKKLENVVPVPGPKGAKLYDSAIALNLIYNDVGDLSTERAKLTVLQQQLAELKIGELRGELVSITEVQKEVMREYAYVRAQMRSIPSKMAKPLSMVTDPNEIHARIKAAVDESLTELTADTKYEQPKPTSTEINRSEEGGVSSDTDTESGGVGGQV
jgi:phage terminase Nu1 subunit (DNA packaging protein)